MTNETTQLQIHERAALDPAELADVRQLAERGQASGVEPRLVWRALTDASRPTISHFLCRRAGALVGFLTVEGLDGDDAEGTVLADPAEAPGPIVAALLAAAQQVSDQHGGGPIMLALDRRAEPLTAALREHGLSLHMTECLMLRAHMPAPALPASELRVAPATQAEALAVAAILAEDLGMQVAELHAPISMNMQRPHYRYWIATLGDEPVGTINVQTLNDLPYIYGFVVRPEFRGRGFGRQLLSFVLAELLRDGPQPIYLEVDPENPPALTLYESLGFTIVVTFDYYREPGSLPSLIDPTP